jgi:hypothetical protein
MDLKLSAVLTLQPATIGVLVSFETLLSPFPPLICYVSFTGFADDPAN